MALQSLILKIKGLFTNLNEFSSAPEGALLVADNISIDKDNIAEPRKGYDKLATGYSDSADRTDKNVFYQDKQIAHHGTLGSADTLSYFNSGVWTGLSGTYSAPSDAKMKFSKSNKNLYFTTDSGVYKMDSYSSTPVKAGSYKALDLVGSTTGSSGFLAEGDQVAYRMVWGYEDANNNLILGAPSQREIVTNATGSGSSKDVSITFTIPDGITTSWFYQVYRTGDYDEAVEPNDEMQLVYQDYPTSGEITAKTITFTDSITSDLRGATLYTSPSQQGIAYQNEQPPIAKDIAVFGGCTFYLNSTSKHRYYLTLISVGASDGVQVDDTLSIDGVTYTAKSSETIASGYFEVVTSGSTAQNIRDTALSLVRVINRYSSSTVYAYYLSGTNDLPGKILLEERSIGGSAFALTTSRATCWNPSNIPTSGVTEVSTNSEYSNGLHWSKPDEPEHVPLANFQLVGSGNSPGRRIIPLREALIIEKDDGVYRLTGTYPNFNIELLDSSAKIIGEETPAVLDNQIFGLSDQGVIAISDGVKIISYPIENDIRSLVSQNLDLVKEIAFGVGYEFDRKYYLFLPSSSGDTYCTQAYVYNTITKTWVRHTLDASCGTVYNNNIYLGHGRSEYIRKDRKNYTYLDYADYGFTTSITAINSKVISLDAGTDNITVGDILYQSDSLFAIITAIDTVESTVTVLSDPGFTTASCDILYAVNSTITWTPVVTGNPGIQKQYHTLQLLLKEDFTGDATLSFSSELENDEETVTLAGASISSWGLFSWGGPSETTGGANWGGGVRRFNRRQWVPRGKQRASELVISFNHYYGYTYWQLQGVSIHGTQGTEGTTR